MLCTYKCKGLLIYKKFCFPYQLYDLSLDVEINVFSNVGQLRVFIYFLTTYVLFLIDILLGWQINKYHVQTPDFKVQTFDFLCIQVLDIHPV